MSALNVYFTMPPTQNWKGTYCFFLDLVSISTPGFCVDIYNIFVCAQYLSNQFVDFFFIKLIGINDHWDMLKT